MAVIVWLTIFVTSFALGYPLAFGMFLGAVAYVILSHINLATILNIMVIQYEGNYELLAVPLFIFTAKVMNASRLTDRLFKFAGSFVGPVRGGLGHVNVIANMIFAGMSGSEIADISGLGLMEVKAMEDAGYDKPFSCALSASAATLGPIIPPSIPMVIYAVISGTSIGYLFLGGIGPGVILAACLMVWIGIISKKRNYPVGHWYKLGEFFRSLFDSFLVILAPVMLLGGIYGGVFTPTEAAAVVSVYALFLSLVVYRTVGLKTVYKVVVESVVATGFTSFIIGCALLFGYAMAREQIPAEIANFFVGLGVTQSKVLVLLSLNVLFLFLGAFIDATASLLIVIPIILPLVQAAHIDPVHFGVVVVLNLMIGLSTPPYGEAPIIISRLTDTPLPAVIRETLKFIVFMIAALAIISIFPNTVLWIPHLAGYKG
ncbi:MAG TPA: TRAP transporter large permease [Spirochaetia bacterium]|nr:TRAP transporter large permease [Spirochaetia bacterium]